MVALAQSAEHWIVAPEVTGSSPVGHPISLVATACPSTSHPHVFEWIEIVHELEGSGLEATAVRRAIELSATRYCTATAMLSAGPAEIHHRYRIRRDGRPIEAEEVVVAGPGASYELGP